LTAATTDTECADSAHVAGEPILAEIDAIGASQIAEDGKQKSSSRAGAACAAGPGQIQPRDPERWRERNT
jgi:hypothetical protein